MRPLIFATLAMFWLPACSMAQTPPPSGAATIPPSGVATIAPSLDPRGNLAGPHTNQTSGGESDNPAPHIYKKGEHINRAYGAFDVVTKWDQFNLPQPPEGAHWVHFAENYLLVKDESGLITDIVKAS